ncbi:MAG TPA: protein translocase subunit SecF, partial [Planctomycetaceae bacterium]|nr:protein translocase subunit SecF [Planctomycetaceae bacterium]
EFATGSSMKMAIRNAFGRATSAIVDSNLTSIITGVILYAVGSEQVKGFAVTLVLGVGFCMYTAIYCSRTVMDVIEKNRWVSRFTMLRLMTRTSIDFIGAGKIAVLVSCLLILVGAAGVVARGKGIFGIDFGGGVGIEAVFKTSQSIDTVRSTLNSLELDDLGVSNLSLLPESAEKESRETGIKVAPNTHFMITTSTPHQDEIDAETYLRIVTGKIKEAFKDSLVYNKLDYTFLEKAADSNEGTTNADAASTTVVNPQALDVSLVICPSMTEAALRSAIDGRWQRLVDEQKLSGDFRYTLKSVKEGVLASNGASILWTFSTTTASREQVETVLGLMKSEMDASPYFPSSSTVGGSVAADTRNSAILAVLGSLVCIVIYMWFRFQHIVYGIAATVTLVHNILIVLGFVALSAYVTNYLGFLQVNEFKIDLTMIAALLTLIGYSLNDTIILFDRIRENRGKSPLLTGKMINAAINQTLSRTVLTSMTTLFTCAVLYFWGGDGIHSFAFALMTGVVVGTYGSIYIASTLLLWLIEMRQRAVVRSK